MAKMTLDKKETLLAKLMRKAVSDGRLSRAGMEHALNEVESEREYYSRLAIVDNLLARFQDNSEQLQYFITGKSGPETVYFVEHANHPRESDYLKPVPYALLMAKRFSDRRRAQDAFNVVKSYWKGIRELQVESEPVMRENPGPSPRARHGESQADFVARTVRENPGVDTSDYEVRNLDDEGELDEFIQNFGNQDGIRLANMLGIKGPGSKSVANHLKNYAWNKRTAMQQRKWGDIVSAQMYERICEQIYNALPESVKW